MAPSRARFSLADDGEGEAHELSEQANNSENGARTSESGAAHDERGRSGRADAPDSARPTSSTVEKQSTPSDAAAAEVDTSKPNIFLAFFLYQLSWVKPNLTWKSMRVVIRCAIAAWAGLILLLARDSQHVLGQASFLILVGRWNISFALLLWINRQYFGVVAFVAPPVDAMAVRFLSFYSGGISEL
jgi:hypothetical protein